MTTSQVSASDTVGNALLSSQTTTAAKKPDPLGRDAFLTMLVAQLKNQDPLNPMQGADFSAQLAQFSSLEQLFKVNDNLANINTTLGPNTQKDLMDYIGKTVTSNSSTLSLANGEATGGAYTIGTKANVVVDIYDSTGAKVAQVKGGQQDAGTHAVKWDGKSDSGEIMADGTYAYDVQAVDDGYAKVSVDTTLTGTITGVTYENKTPYLLMGNHLVDPSSIVKVGQSTTSTAIPA